MGWEMNGRNCRVKGRDEMEREMMGRTCRVEGREMKGRTW